MAKTLTAGKAAGARTKQDKRAYAQLGHNTWRKAFMQHYWLYILMIPGILYMLISTTRRWQAWSWRSRTSAPTMATPPSRRCSAAPSPD